MIVLSYAHPGTRTKGIRMAPLIEVAGLTKRYSRAAAVVRFERKNLIR